MTAVHPAHAAAPSVAQQLARLHSARGGQELDVALDRLLRQLLPDANAALCVVGERDDCYKVRVALGALPWRAGDTVQLDTWPAGAACRMPLRYREHEIGVFVSDHKPGERVAADLAGLLTNIAVALVNITLNDEAQRSTEQYCASIQALEEGIVLFQENDPEAVTARLLTLASTILGASACALFAFRDIGNRDSELVLQQCMGLPEELLYTMRPLDGNAEWPRCWLESPAFFVDRAQDAHLAGLDPGYLPPQLRNLVSLPLQYHGVVAGIIVLLNVDAGADAISQRMERMQAVCQLAAALLHRLSLEAEHQRAARTQHEIELAATIQKRLLPRSAPQVAGLEFAWHSRAAQQIGGDYVDLVGSQAGELHAVVADVSGHGVTAGLLMGSFRSTWRAEAQRQRPSD